MWSCLVDLRPFYSFSDFLHSVNFILRITVTPWDSPFFILLPVDSGEMSTCMVRFNIYSTHTPIVYQDWNAATMQNSSPRHNHADREMHVNQGNRKI